MLTGYILSKKWTLNQFSKSSPTFGEAIFKKYPYFRMLHRSNEISDTNRMRKTLKKKLTAISRFQAIS